MEKFFTFDRKIFWAWLVLVIFAYLYQEIDQLERNNF